MMSKRKTPIGKSDAALRVCVPVALSQIYMCYAAENSDKSYSAEAYQWLFEDDADKIAGFSPDVFVLIGHQKLPFSSHIIAQGALRRSIVASPKLLYATSVKKPSDLENLRYASLDETDPCELELKTSCGDTFAVSPKTCMYTNNLFAARMAAQLAMGFTILPKFLVQCPLHDGTLINLLPLWSPSSLPVSVLISADCQQPDTAQRLCKNIMKTLTTVSGFKLSETIKS